ncbi:class I adenylate-forming enzyme family protein [Rhodococcus opacus]|jgi:hypothetical protein|uniref:class I adenylate-forming enzyme family protein n=1 Tax=Rhodococcus opacus TaxID=37919 RepID=UPI000EA95BE3|nr:class I adenylate-forming enzyme family protein [Rhodococcus opacus]QZS52708.1 acyl--CoA ligase [Rhodococcus opacus]RKM65293.1 hypothetical protein COO55_40900 [Rhodococcus opacus]
MADPPAAASLPALLAACATEPPDAEALVVGSIRQTYAEQAVPLSHRDLIANGFHIGERMGLGGDDRVWFGSPLCSNTDAFTVDGWFRTGDRLVQNSDGTFSFIDRMSDMIKTSGINVSPAEIENFLVAHPEVSEALVVGAPHPSLDEVAVAFVVVRSSSVTPEDLIRHCKARIAGYKVPHIVSIVAGLPRTVTGKLVRRGLRDQAAALVDIQLTQDRNCA